MRWYCVLKYYLIAIIVREEISDTIDWDRIFLSKFWRKRKKNRIIEKQYLIDFNVEQKYST